MAKTSIFSGMVIASPPQTIFPGLAINHRDFRLHFAINNGSLSLIDNVPVYTANNLDFQLDDNTRLCVDNYIEIDFSRKLVILPKLPFSDYSSSSSSNSGIPSPPGPPDGMIDSPPDLLENTFGALRLGGGGGSATTPTNNNSGALPSSYSASVLDCLKTLLPYLSKNKQNLLLQLLQDPQHIHVKFHKMNFRCRLLKKSS
jgi:hypothetical protein